MSSFAAEPPSDTEPSAAEPPHGDAREVILELCGITRTFPTAERPILDGLDLTVHRGEMLAIIGPSGSGKSTLLNILGLLDRPTEGTYILSGQDTAELNPAELDQLRAQTLGFVFQDAHLLPHETVARNTALGLRTQGVPEDQQRQITAQTLARLRLTHRTENLGSTLSGGERQRVAIARSISTAPSVLLADEPTGNLDQEITEEVITDLRALADAGTTVLIITHDDHVARRADRCLRMAHGRLHPTELAPAPRQDVGPAPAAAPTPEVAPELEAAPAASSPSALQRSRRAAWTSPLWEALAALTTRPGRALVLCLAYALAIGGLVASSAIMASASQQISARLDQAALDEVRISPQIPGFTPAQADQAARRLNTLEGVRRTGYRAEMSSDVTRFSEAVPGPHPVAGGRVLAADPAYLDLSEAAYATPGERELYRSSAEANLREQETTTSPHPDSTSSALPARPGVLLGRQAAEQLGIPGADAGISVSVNGHPLSVLGIIESAPRDPTLTNAVIVDPVTAAFFGTTDPLLLIRTDPGYPAPVAEIAALALDPVTPQNYTVQTVVDLRTLDRGVSDDIAVLGFISSWGILFLAVLSAGTTLYMAVQNRKREIALRRAIGASSGAIFRMFLAEGALIGGLGAVLGVSLGTVAALVVCLVNRWEPVFSAVPLLMGLAAVVPALLTARERPAHALRG